MQIKRGPFGYYACEKLDSPDRLCKYAEEVIAGSKSDFYLTPGTEYVGSGIMCYYEFSGYMPVTDPEFSVFSSGNRVISRRKEAKLLSLRRSSLGDLFYSFVGFLDNLISPSCIVMDPDMVFTDPEGITIKLCCLPVKSKPEDLCLSSLGASRFEQLLNCDFFKSVISDDERNALVFSVKENNESMFLKIAGILKSDDGNSPLLQEKESAFLLFNDAAKSDTKTLSGTEKDLMISGISAVFSFLSLKLELLLPCLLFFILSLIILGTTLLNRRKHKGSERDGEKQKQSEQRSAILFSDTAPSYQNTIQRKNKNNYKMNKNSLIVKPDEQDLRISSLKTGRLLLISDHKGINTRYAVYLDKTTIGSDCFLSDIVLDDPDVSPLHAAIEQKNGSFYLLPYEGTGKTYIEDSPVGNGRSYEIKTGQKITFGDIDFRFSTDNTH